MASFVSTTVTLVSGMEFSGQDDSGHSVTMDAAPASGGRESGMSPMQMLLMALGGCTGMDVISILRKKRQNVTHYSIVVNGTRAEDYPKVYTDITVEHVVRGPDVTEHAVARAVELSATKYCSVSAMLGKVANVVHKHRVEREG